MKGDNQMGNLINSSKLFLKRNSSTILTCVGAVGVIATAVTAVRATPKAMSLLNKAEQDKHDDLTVMEKIKVAGPAYIPSALIGASTIACIFGANILNKRSQAALTSAYALLDTSYKEYKRKVKELHGDGIDQEVIQSLVKERYSEQDILEADDGKELFFDFYSLQFFRSTTDEVLAAERYMNDVFQSRGYALLSEFYDKLGITVADCDWNLGWSKYAGEYLYGYDSIEFDHYVSVMDNGIECCAIRMPFEPTPDIY